MGIAAGAIATGGGPIWCSRTIVSAALNQPVVRHGNPGDRPSGLNCFVSPAMQQFQQVFRVRLQFLQRFPANPGIARRPASLIDRVQ